MASAASAARTSERASAVAAAFVPSSLPPFSPSLSLRPLVRSLCSLCVPILRNGGQTDALPSSQSVSSALRKHCKRRLWLSLSLLPDCVWRRGEEEGGTCDRSVRRVISREEGRCDRVIFISQRESGVKAIRGRTRRGVEWSGEASSFNA